MKEYDFKKSYEMFAAVEKVVPNGINFPRTPRFLTFGSFPVFTARTEGARFWDVDGNEFIDFMCAYGAVVLGYQHPKVEEARQRQAGRCDAANVPSEYWLKFSEFLVDEIPSADWVVYGKNGSDVTSFAAMCARLATGRPGMVLAHHAYHGLHHWCIESDAGIPGEYKAHVYRFHYNDLEDLEEIIRKHRGEIAAVFLTPVGHWALRDQEEPAPGFFEGVRQLCDREGMLLLIDDIRCGFRIKYEGSHSYYSRIEPDLICFGKAIANGHPLSVCVGRKEFFEAAKKVYWSGTHFYSGADMAAAMACLEEVKASGVIEKIRQMGTRFQETLREQARSRGLQVSVTGHPAMPFMTFAEDAGFEKMRFFCGEAARRGVFLHPHHNWFISGALTEDLLNRALEITDLAFQKTTEKYA